MHRPKALAYLHGAWDQPVFMHVECCTASCPCEGSFSGSKQDESFCAGGSWLVPKAVLVRSRHPGVLCDGWGRQLRAMQVDVWRWCMQGLCSWTAAQNPLAQLTSSCSKRGSCSCLQDQACVMTMWSAVGTACACPSYMSLPPFLAFLYCVLTASVAHNFFVVYRVLNHSQDDQASGKTAAARLKYPCIAPAFLQPHAPIPSLSACLPQGRGQLQGKSD